MLKGMTKYHLLVLLREPMNLIFGMALPFFFLFVGMMNDDGAELVSIIFIPIYITIAIMILCFTDSALSHAYARQVKFLQRLRMTPVKPIKYILTGIFSRLCVLLAFSVIFIGVAGVMYDLGLANRNWLFFIAILILIFAMFYSIAMFTANILKSAKNSQSLVYVVFFALLIIGGNAALQLENMPGILQAIVRVLPPVQAVVALQTAWIGNVALHWSYVVGMAAYTLVFCLLSLKFFRYE